MQAQRSPTGSRVARLPGGACALLQKRTPMAEENDDLFGLEINIDSFKETLLENGENAFIINLNVDNKTSKNTNLKLQHS